MKYLSDPWPWYVAGPLIGLLVPLLLIFGNKAFGISSSLQHICAASIPSKLKFFNYNWKQESWLLIFAFGVILGGLFCRIFMWNDQNVEINPTVIEQLKAYGITNFEGYMPSEIFSLSGITLGKALLFFFLGGFLIGFGTRYADGCTSGHSIFGLSNLNWPSLVATICFMIGGFFSAWVIVPYFLKWVLL